MTLSDVSAWLKTLETKADNYYIGTLNKKADKSIGIYQLKGNNERHIAIGGTTNKKTDVIGVSLLVHYNNSSTQTQEFAQKLYNEISNLSNAVIGGEKVAYFNLLQNMPVDVGTDENGVFECVIELKIYYGKV